jgi:hypothetical protein
MKNEIQTHVDNVPRYGKLESLRDTAKQYEKENGIATYNEKPVQKALTEQYVKLYPSPMFHHSSSILLYKHI